MKFVETDVNLYARGSDGGWVPRCSLGAHDVLEFCFVIGSENRLLAG